MKPDTVSPLGTYHTGSLTAGTHEIQVEHDPDPNLGRNCTYTKIIWATIPEDLNLDGVVDIRDISSAARPFGATYGQPR